MGRAPGILRVVFGSGPAASPPSWSCLQPWTEARAVTVADIRGDLAAPALEIALCSDLVVARKGDRLLFPPGNEIPSAGLLWAAGRAGRRGLALALLGGGPVSTAVAFDRGLVHTLLAKGEKFSELDGSSRAALTAARDLLRSSSRGTGALELELATFRFLFALGEPREGALAFLERRDPRFHR